MAVTLSDFETIGKFVGKAIKPLQDRIAELESAPTKFVGTWVAGTYAARSIVSYAGSMWHANEQTDTKPGTSASWTLCVKRGRDGKDGRDAEKAK
jgi:hypothetical protein